MAKKKKIPEVYEIDDRMGLFTIGVTDKYTAYEMFLDWYYEEHRTKEGRFIFDEYWGISVDQIDLEQIKETEMMRCHGENCNGRWWIDDSECVECEKKLDHRTKQKTFYIYW